MLKQVLLSTGYFVDNSYLDDYLELVQKPFSFSGYSEKHHVIPAMVYNVRYSIGDRVKARKLADKDPDNFLVDLLFKDHCKAHWLLYCCTHGEVKACNARAYILMTGQKFDHILELSEAEYEEVQLYRNRIMNEDDYYWSLEEKRLLAEYYSTHSFEELKSIFGRSREAIIGTANLMGLTRRLWLKEDEQWLIENYDKYSRKECAAFLGKTEASINKKCTMLKLYKAPVAWTAEQNEWLIKNYTKYTVSESAKILARSYNAVRSQASKLGLKNPITETGVKKKKKGISPRFRWTAETEQWLLDNFSTLGIHGCATQLNLSDSSVYHKYFRLTHNTKE